MPNDLYKKLLQLFIIGYQGTKPPEKLFRLIKDGLGGIIFFAENLKTRKDFIKTIQRLKSSASTPLFLSIDQEGGLVERTIFLDEKVEYLAPKALSRLDKNNLKTHYEILAQDLLSMGLNLNFAPVVDVNTNPNNPIIGVRSFGNTPEIVNKNTKIVIDTFKKNGLISCAKHFPGHGDTNSDSHKVMPVVDMDFDEFYKNHLICFKKAIGNGVDSVMVSHIWFPFFDEKPTPASLSPNAINYLKSKLNFKGIVFSDDMVMGGISENYGLKESIILALKAGIDSLIFRNATDELLETIKEISQTKDKMLITSIENAYEKIIKFKRDKISDKKSSEFDTEKAQKVIDKIAEKTPLIIKNDGLLPLNINKKTKIVRFNNEENFNLSRVDYNLAEALQNASEIIYPLDPADDDIEEILNKIDNDDVVIFLSYNAILYKKQIELFNKIKNSKILVTCGIASDIELMGDAASIIELNCYKTPVLKVLGDILLK